MADQFEECNVNNTLLSESTFGIKEDESVDNKVYVSVTTISIDNVESQYNTHDKMRGNEVPTILDSIKTEQNEMVEDKIKIEEGLTCDNIKIEVDSVILYCEDCHEHYEGYCIQCRMLERILNKYNADNSADELPDDILDIQNPFGHFGIYAIRIIPANVTFGPFTGLSRTECVWKIKGGKFIVQTDESINWMRHINPAKNTSEQNLIVFQYENNLYYRSTRQIHRGDELLVYFGAEYEDSLNTNVEVDFIPTPESVFKDVFACTHCCLGFSLKPYLAKHKTVCQVDDKFSIEELVQCPYCKIYLGQNEYNEYHMTYCWERNERKRIPSTLSNQIKEVSGLKTYGRQMYRWEQSKFSTKQKTNLKKHGNIQYSQGERCKHKLHVENTHVCVGVKEESQQSVSDFKNVHIKIEQSSSQGQMKRFSCSVCGFRTIYKQYLIKHIKSKHLQEFDCKCDKCEFRTNNKQHLERHVKTNHLQQFDYKCNKCEFKTNHVTTFKKHAKTKHLKEFDYKCNKCELRTNHKKVLDKHVKTKHLKEFDYKCDKCEFGTNQKYHLYYHIKQKHLQEFDYKCDKCDFGTNYKNVLQKHAKTKHLKEFDYKCNKCELRTNHKKVLDKHVKTKHLKEFDYKCDKCEFGTNQKYHLYYHIKQKHLQEFDYKCDKCDFGTNYKNVLQKHVKTKHLQEFDYECGSCEFKTNCKQNFERHIKVKHLQEFDYKCATCEFITNIKGHLERHVKTKHLQIYDYKCDKCEYRTNRNDNLKVHIKTKHLKQFEYKCDKCDLKTNHRSNLELHVKTKHFGI